MPADWFILIPAGITLIKMGKQAKWSSVALQMCDCTPSSPWDPTHSLSISSATRGLPSSRACFSRALDPIVGLVWLAVWPADSLISIPASTHKLNGMCVTPMPVRGGAGEDILLEDEGGILPLKLHQVQSCFLVTEKGSVLSPCCDVLFLHKAIQNDAKTTAHFRLCLCVCMAYQLVGWRKW